MGCMLGAGMVTVHVDAVQMAKKVVASKLGWGVCLLLVLVRLSLRAAIAPDLVFAGGIIGVPRVLFGKHSFPVAAALFLGCLLCYSKVSRLYVLLVQG